MPIGFLFAEYFFVAIDKNLSYFGGGMQGVINMLEHGMGQVFSLNRLPDYFWSIIVPLLGLFVLLFFFVHKKIRPTRRLLLVSTVGGFFGYTVLTLSIPLLLCELVSQKRWLGKVLKPQAPLGAVEGKRSDYS